MTLVPAGPLHWINGPLPRRRPFDLLHYVEFVDLTSEHDLSGVQVFTYPPDLPGVQNPCSDGSYGTKDEGGDVPIPQFGGFTAYLPITCKTRGMLSWNDFKTRTIRAFEARESYAVERQLALDLAGLSQPHLTEGGADAELLAAAAVSPNEGLALIENYIAANSGTMGLIHADPALVTAWSKEFLVFHEGGDLVTANGTPVVAGAGYVGIHPSDKSAPGATQSWAFATGPVQVTRAELKPLPAEVKEAVDRESNIVTFRAERDYVVDWDTVLLGEVLVDRSL